MKEAENIDRYIAISIKTFIIFWTKNAAQGGVFLGVIFFLALYSTHGSIGYGTCSKLGCIRIQIVAKLRICMKNYAQSYGVIGKTGGFSLLVLIPMHGRASL